MKTFKKQVHIYVDAQNGDDAARGGRKTPFRTLPRAYALLHSKVVRTDEETAYTIHMAAGEYVLDAPLSFDGKRVRALDYSLSLVGDAGAIITSGVPVKGSDFRKVEGKPYYAYQLPAGQSPNFRDITVNGKLVPICESAVERTLAYSIPNNKDRKDPENAEPKLYVREESLVGMTEDTLFCELWIKVEWQVHAVRVTSIDRNDVRVDDNGGRHIAVHINPEDWEVFMPGFYGTLAGRPYHFKNHISCLEKKNSFYYDKKNTTLYVYPDDGVDMASARVAYPTLENLLLFRDARNVSVTGIEFTGATSNYVTENGYVAGQGGRIKKNKIGFLTHSVVQARNSYNLYFADCRFHDIGGDGINTDGITDSCTVERCYFDTIGMSAIRIGKFMGGWDYIESLSQNIRIVNNYITEPGAVFRSNVGIVIGSVYNLTLCYNTLINTPYSAVSVGWSWSRTERPVGASVNILNAEIAYNRVENFMYCMKDGGALYTLGGNCGIEDHNYYNFMHDNYCVAGPTVGRNSGGYTILYHDGSSSNWKTSRNVIVVNPDAPSNHNYISYQSIPHQQVYNMLAENNYLVNMDDPYYIFGRNCADPAKNRANFIKMRNNKIGLRMETLDKTARAIIENAGAEGYKKKL